MTKVAVLGLGYIGLPTAIVLANHGHQVCGFDVNAKVVETLRRGEAHFEEPGLQAELDKALKSGRFVPTTSLEPADVHIICVPTPHDPVSKDADLKYVESAGRMVAKVLRRGDLVILESTVPAGTTEKVLGPILEQSGLRCGSDVLLAHCPETVLPGNMLREILHNHRVVGGATPEATQKARDLYATFVKSEIITTDATTAEFVKLIENTYRDVNIALANELAKASIRLGIDVREAIRIANKHPRVHLHQPGPGVGGHCIPVDPWFVLEALPEARMVRTAREVNDGMPRHVVETVQQLIGGQPSPRVAVLGLAFKGNVDDVRESPTYEILRLLRRLVPGVEVRLNDPHVESGPEPLIPFEDAVDGADCILVVTDHDAYRKLDPVRAAKLVRRRVVYDTRGVLDVGAWRDAGFEVNTISGPAR